MFPLYPIIVGSISRISSWLATAWISMMNTAICLTWRCSQPRRVRRVLRVLHVIPHLEYSGAARQLQLLATGLPRDQFEVRVCALGLVGPVAKSLQSAGIAVDALGWNRPFDLSPFRS